MNVIAMAIVQRCHDKYGSEVPIRGLVAFSGGLILASGIAAAAKDSAPSVAPAELVRQAFNNEIAANNIPAAVSCSGTSGRRAHLNQVKAVWWKPKTRSPEW